MNRIIITIAMLFLLITGTVSANTLLPDEFYYTYSLDQPSGFPQVTIWTDTQYAELVYDGGDICHLVTFDGDEKFFNLTDIARHVLCNEIVPIGDDFSGEDGYAEYVEFLESVKVVGCLIFMPVVAR